MPDPHLSQLIRMVAGDKGADDILDTLQIDRVLLMESAGPVSGAAFAMALNAILFNDLLGRVPAGAAYVADRRRSKERISMDHGALRTIRFENDRTGELPAGILAFSRILEPLGYRAAGTYPSPKRHLNGTAFVHREFPEALPQLFVSEVNVGGFSSPFQAAARRVFDGTRDPLTANTVGALAEFADQGRCEMRYAAPAMREIVAAFGRWHDVPTWADYQTLLAESAECAWVATEGFALHHATDRVADVAMTACAQRSLGRPVGDTIATSQAGSVRRTAFKPESVRRPFRADDGTQIEVDVPGSFYEFISRDAVAGADGRRRLDLRFDEEGSPGPFKRTGSG